MQTTDPLHRLSPIYSRHVLIKNDEVGEFFRRQILKKFFAAIQPFLKDIAEMRHYEVLNVRWAR